MTSELRLELRRVLDAPPPEVWRALTDPDQLARWWGPTGFTAPSVALDLRVGGSYRIEMQPPGGAAFFLHGVFREVSAPVRLVYTFLWEPPDPDDRETVVTLVLRELGGRTGLVLDQGPFRTEARLSLHRNGWSESWEKLAEMLSSRGARPR